VQGYASYRQCPTRHASSSTATAAAKTCSSAPTVHGVTIVNDWHGRQGPVLESRAGYASRASSTRGFAPAHCVRRHRRQEASSSARTAIKITSHHTSCTSECAIRCDGRRAVCVPLCPSAIGRRSAAVRRCTFPHVQRDAERWRMAADLSERTHWWSNGGRRLSLWAHRAARATRPSRSS
jgi:hypothetical protein